MLYSHPEWPMIHPQVIKNEMRDIFEDNWMMKLLFSPSWLINHLNIIQGKKERGQPVTFTDFFGYLIGDVLRRKVSTDLFTWLAYDADVTRALLG